MATFSLELSADEITTRTLFNDALDREWTPYRASVAVIFVRESAYSLPVAALVDRVNMLGAYTITADTLQKVLTGLVYEKVLRSRMISGVRHYEVNY